MRAFIVTVIAASALYISCQERKPAKTTTHSAKMFDTTYVVWGHDSTDYCIYHVHGKDTEIAGVESIPDYYERAEQRRRNTK